jgi:hypothetical protein
MCHSDFHRGFIAQEPVALTSPKRLRDSAERMANKGAEASRQIKCFYFVTILASPPNVWMYRLNILFVKVFRNNLIWEKPLCLHLQPNSLLPRLPVF